MNARVAFSVSLMYGLRGVVILLTSQCLLSASAQDGFGAAQDNPTAANRAEVHLHNYGEFDKACIANGTGVAQISESRANRRR
jgi:hypothetical protein